LLRFDQIHYRRKRGLVVFCVVTIALSIDMIISSFSDVLLQHYSKQNIWVLITLFVAITAIIYAGGQYLLNDFVKKVSSKLRYTKRDIGLMYKILSIIQYVIVSIISIIILQIIFLHQYSLLLIILATIVSYIPASLILGILSYRFLAWFRTRRNSITLLFFIGSGMVGVNLAVGVVIHSYYMWSEKPAKIITEQSQIATAVTFPEITPQSVGILSPLYLYAFFIPLNLAYLFAWGGCSILLHYYSKILGEIKYWLIISIPLAIFLVSIYPTILSLPIGSFTFYDQNLITYRILFRFAGTAGGIFVFSVALLSIAKSMSKIKGKHTNDGGNRTDEEQEESCSTTADYMTLSAYGVAMLAVTVQASIIQTSYPPFGVSASSFVALASYLFSLGFYFSAISVSQDMLLRQSIRKYAIEESKLLDSIGTAQMEQQIENKVLKLAKQHSDKMIEDTGVVSSLLEEDMKNYCHEVLVEIGKIKRDSNDASMTNEK
jgi:hypothetical protein